MLDLLMRKHEMLLLSCPWQMAVTQEISQVGEEKVRELGCDQPSGSVS